MKTSASASYTDRTHWGEHAPPSRHFLASNFRFGIMHRSDALERTRTTQSSLFSFQLPLRHHAQIGCTEENTHHSVIAFQLPTFASASCTEHAPPSRHFAASNFHFGFMHRSDALRRTRTTQSSLLASNFRFVIMHRSDALRSTRTTQ